MGHRAAPTGLHRKPRLAAIQRLDLALFVGAQHDGMLRWIQVQAYDIHQLRLKVRVLAQFEGLAQVRLQAAALPDPMDR